MERVRRRLRDQGLSETYIERLIADLIDRQQARLAWMRSQATQPSPDDRGYRPRTPDPLLTGAARVTGQTAKAVGRTKAITRHEHQAAQQ